MAVARVEPAAKSRLAFQARVFTRAFFVAAAFFVTLRGVPCFLVNNLPTMKTHLHLLLVLGSGFAALLLGAGLASAFAVAVVAGVAGMAFNDYAGHKSRI